MTPKDRESSDDVRKKMADHSPTNLSSSSLDSCGRCGSGPVTITPYGRLCSIHATEMLSAEEDWLPLLRRTDGRRPRLALGEPDFDGLRSKSDPGNSARGSFRALSSVGIRIG